MGSVAREPCCQPSQLRHAPPATVIVVNTWDHMQVAGVRPAATSTARLDSFFWSHFALDKRPCGGERRRRRPKPNQPSPSPGRRWPVRHRGPSGRPSVRRGLAMPAFPSCRPLAGPPLYFRRRRSARTDKFDVDLNPSIHVKLLPTVVSAAGCVSCRLYFGIETTATRDNTIKTFVSRCQTRLPGFGVAGRI